MFNLSSYNDLLYAIGMKSVSLVQVMEKLTNQKRSALEGFDITRLFRGNRRIKPAGRTGLQVEGVDNMKISIAGCCMPVYGDDIVGYITKGQGVKVHRRDCPNIRGQQSRLINVRWEEDDTTKQYDCWLKIEATDRSYLISDIVTVVAQYKAGLMGINSEVLPDKVNVTVDLKVRVNTADQLHLLMTNIRKLDSVDSVDRIIK